jgi:hypothetical protein
MQTMLFYFGAGIIFVWGVGHLIPTRNVVAGFGGLSTDNTRIIVMEWLAEGLTLCFLGAIVIVLVVGARDEQIGAVPPLAGETDHEAPHPGVPSAVGCRRFGSGRGSD